MTIDKVKEIIANQLSVKVEDLKDDTNIAEELGADSLDLVEILMSLEDEFGVSKSMIEQVQREAEQKQKKGFSKSR